VKVKLEILDPRLPGWGFPSWGSSLAAGLDLHACIESPVVIKPQTSPILISAGIAFRIGNPDWCAMLVPRSGLGHGQGLVLGNSIGVVDADYEGPCLISAWNRNPMESGREITIRPGDRIAQLVFTRITRPKFVIVPAIATRVGRRAGSFGSTGVEAACPDPRPARNS
jgi:dUTP pyrophosphatase